MILMKGNVERIAGTPEMIEKLKSDGFKELGTTPKETAVKKPLDSMTVAELKELAKEKGIDGCSALTKDELLEVLKDVV